jgi:hypothetical protein
MKTGHLTAPLDIQTRTTDGEMFIDIVPFGYRQAVMSFDLVQSKALVEKLIALRQDQLEYWIANTSLDKD